MLKTTREQLEQLKRDNNRDSIDGFAGSAVLVDEIAALLHDATVAHGLVDEIQKALARLGDIAPTSEEAVRNKYRDLGVLEALLSAAKGAE